MEVFCWVFYYSIVNEMFHVSFEVLTARFLKIYCLRRRYFVSIRSRRQYSLNCLLLGIDLNDTTPTPGDLYPAFELVWPP
jgi:hypothetical protein